MYSIEKFLLDNKFKKTREYDSGVIVYSNAEEELEYTTEVVIFTSRKIWEIAIHNPYAMNLQGYKDYDKENFIEIHKALAVDHVDYAFGFKKWLEEQVPDPWEVVE